MMNRIGNQQFERHNRFQNIVTTFMIIVFILMIAWFVFIGVVFYSASKDISKIGLGGVIEQIWCGERKDCKLNINLSQ